MVNVKAAVAIVVVLVLGVWLLYESIGAENTVSAEDSISPTYAKEIMEADQRIEELNMSAASECTYSILPAG